jgi:large subunit ribosomal protein L25
MSVDFTLNAESRSQQGKSANRRLRHQGKVPAVMYGGGQEPVSVTFEHNTLLHDLEQEAVFSHVLTINVDGKPQKAIIRDVQRHPYKPTIMHMDLLRVREDVEIRVHVPIHFLNEEECPAVKVEKGIVSHVMVDIEVECLPKNLPEFLELDIMELAIGDSLKLSDIKLPSGVAIPELEHDEDEDHDYDAVVVHILPPTVEEVDEPVEAAEGVEIEAKEVGESKVDSGTKGEDKSSGDDS